MKKVKVEQATYFELEKFLYVLWAFFCGMFFYGLTPFSTQVFIVSVVIYLIFILFFVEVVEKK